MHGASPWTGDLRALRCPACAGGLATADAGLSCAGCGTPYPIRDGVLVVKEQSDDNNRVAQDFYDSPLWPKFRFWEKFTWFCNGGERRARNQVLRHLPAAAGPEPARRGDRRRRLPAAGCPPTGEVVGIDVSWSQLAACRRRVGGPVGPAGPGRGRDAAVPRRPVRRRAQHRRLQLLQRPRGLRSARWSAWPGPAATIVISDELPNLTDRMLGHKLGVPALDRWIVSPADAPGRRVHRHGRAATATSTSARSPSACCPRFSTTKSGVAWAMCWLGRFINVLEVVPLDKGPRCCKIHTT